MDYQETIDYLYNLRFMGSKLGLDNITELLRLMGDPQDSFKTVHIAGTTGKGSVTTMIASILTSAGFRTGRFLSPHVHSYRERISIDGRDIPPEDVVRIVSKIRGITEKMEKHKPTFFEVTTALAFEYFKEQKVGYAVIEVGLGGRLDATNVITPAVAVITTIGMDHTHILGKTVGKIAWEKCGIIKPGIAVVTSARDGLATIRSECKKRNCRLTEVSEYKLVGRSLDGQVFDAGDYKKLRIRLLGEHQLLNAATAVAAARQLGIGEKAVREGLAKASIPIRFEIVRKEPYVVLDGAHNPPSIDALVRALHDLGFEKMFLVFGAMGDKDISTMARRIAPLAEKIVACNADAERAMPAMELAQVLRKYNKECIHRKTVAEAVDYALSLAGQKDLICVTGSLYVAGEAREHLLGLKKSEWGRLAETNITHLVARHGKNT